jgi:hypothetical protein
MSTKEPEVVERSLTRKEFCAVEGISLSYYYNKLKPLGLAPREMQVPGSSLHRISPDARREYHRKLEAFAESEQAKLEFERRREYTKVAAKQAVKSPGHPSNRGKKQRAG